MQRMCSRISAPGSLVREGLERETEAGRERVRYSKEEHEGRTNNSNLSPPCAPAFPPPQCTGD